MSAVELKIERLNQDVFRPFGDVIQPGAAADELINRGRTEKQTNVAHTSLMQEGGDAAVHLYRSKAVELPFEIIEMEAHPLGSQCFVPLQRNPWLVVVAVPGEKPQSIRAFLATAGQGINLHSGVWHHSQLSLSEPADYLVIERQGPGNNLLEHRLQQPLTLISLL